MLIGFFVLFSGLLHTAICGIAMYRAMGVQSPQDKPVCCEKHTIWPLQRPFALVSSLAGDYSS
jgi:hypothetical protein